LRPAIKMLDIFLAYFDAWVMLLIIFFQISDVPKPKAVYVHDVLVKVVASSVSAMDIHLRSGGIANYIVSFPWILGIPS
jgi:hypothetical protein